MKFTRSLKLDAGFSTIHVGRLIVCNRLDAVCACILSSSISNPAIVPYRACPVFHMILDFSRWHRLRMRSLQDLLRRARADGSLDSLVASIHAEPEDGGFELLDEKTSGSPVVMTDASKRRMTEPPERESHMSGTNDEKKVGTPPHSFDLVLPQGVTDLGDWGVTVLEVGKYGKMGYSYVELATSSSQAHQYSYCAWLITQKYRMDLNCR